MTMVEMVAMMLQKLSSQIMTQPVAENEITDGNGDNDLAETSIAVPGNSSVTVPITVIYPFPKAKT